MKTKKIIAGILIFTAIIISCAFLNKTSAVSSGLGYVKITKDRTAKVEYSVEDEETGNIVNNSYTATYKHQLYSLENEKTKNIWKLVTCTENGTQINRATDLYCLRAGLGFTTETGGPNYNPNPVLYDQEYDMIQYYEEVKNYLAGLNSSVTIFNSKDSFNAVMWILDNMLLETATDEEVTAYLKRYAGYEDEDFNLTPLKENILTRADIEAIQQLAIWYFTNSDVAVYNEETLSPLFANITGSPFATDGEYVSIENIFDAAGDRDDGGQFGTMRQEAAETLYSTLIANGKTAMSAAKGNANGLYNINRTITVYLAGNGNAATEQPIVHVRERSTKADISLRKFISAVNGEELEKSRVPQVDTKNLNEIINRKLQTTAEYNHYKDPVKVKIGDKVTYTIRLYNEGEIDAYVKEVTDYIPSWLAYNAYGTDDWDSSKGGPYWTLSENGYVATTLENCRIAGAGGELNSETEKGKKLSEVLIPKAKLNEDPNRKAEDKYILSYVDIEITCSVMTKAPYDTALTNIAEVTKMTDKDGLTLSDRDSEVKNVRIPNNNELPTYNDEYIPEDTENPYYIPGQQDDDDYDKVIIEAPEIDLALRKFITEIGGKKLTGDDSREPQVISSGLRTGAKTAIYNHIKHEKDSSDPIKAEIGDVITYTIRIYNEGDVPGKVTQITDYIDKGLKYVPAGVEASANWWVETELNNYNKVVSTDSCKIVNVGGNTKEEYVQKTLKEAIIPAYDRENDILSYIDVEIHCQIQEVEKTIKLTNIAEITGETDEYDREVKDRDSEPGNVKVPPEGDYSNLPTYKEDEIDLDYVPGQQDDDDFEKVLVIVPQVDLSLRKFITAIDGEELPEDELREPVVETELLDTHKDTTAEYNHTKEPKTVKKGSKVTYTIRVYNEGELNAYVSEITDYLPNYLIYLENSEINKKYGWAYNKETRQVKTTITAAENLAGDEIYEDKLLYSYDNSGTLDYIDVRIECKVDEKALGNGILTNIAQITKIKNEEGKTVKEDRDSVPEDTNTGLNDGFTLPEDVKLPDYTGGANGKNDPYYDGSNKKGENYYPGQEDDDDFEKVLVEPEFDLALRKFITGVQNTQVNNRYPEVTYENGDFTYKHDKTPLEVVTGDIVVYTIRVYNEGELDGYAEEITDDIPKGLEFLPNNDINIEYRWSMLDEDEKHLTGEENVNKAKYLVSDYLSEDQEERTGRDNKIKAFDRTKDVTNNNPDYRDIKIAFKVDYTAKTKEESERIIVNVAQISEDSNELCLHDKDSDPNKDEEYKKDGKNEDDIDYDNVRVKYFDLSLLKWVSQTKVTLNGNTVVSDTGHTAETSKNEAPVKIEIPEKDLKKINIKYVYTIQITNEGEIEGYAEEIRDYIPEGLSFIKEDNTEWNWTESKDGTVTTDYLKDTLLKPGEKAEVPIVLTWVNSQENLGEKVNLAEISKDKNDSNSPDVDSTPDNKAPDEDDIDDAPVILAIKTGGVQTYIGLIAIILITFGSGIGLIKKYVLE